MSLPDGRLIEYVTDGRGRRIGKMVNGVLTKQWLYRDQLKPVAELDGAGNLVSEFIYGTKPNVPDLVVRGGVTYRIVSDQLGSPVLAINTANSGDIPFAATYAAFGERTLVAGVDDWMPFGFAASVYDPDTKLSRFGARDYSSILGRWVSKDPIRFEGGLANIYVYVGNDPVNYVDPRGTDLLGFLLEWDELNSKRNRYNRCPPKPPQPVCSADDNRTWEQDADTGLPIPGLQGKWRGSDGSECRYDSNGNLSQDDVTFNYCPDPATACHIFADVLPVIVFGH